ncbi:MAG: biliverdin-producing heme oxygenase [Archangiaceae bacterium]|nr:biliverdin-producing heme oxygenase [Archangiaceae bacterium]
MLTHRLKLETRPLHDEIERVTGLMSPDLTLDGYRDYLARMYGFHVPLEVALSSVKGWPPGFHLADRLKSGLLADDLTALGVDPQRLPVCFDLPQVNTQARGLGALYVTEGATLGGQIIDRHLEQQLPGCPRTYLRAYGSRTGEMWRGMGVAIEQSVDAERTIETARDTFRLLTRWLDPKRGAHAAA